MSERIPSFKELRVYKLAFEVQQEIFETSRRFPPEERYALTDQVRRALRFKKIDNFSVLTGREQTR